MRYSLRAAAPDPVRLPSPSSTKASSLVCDVSGAIVENGKTFRERLHLLASRANVLIVAKLSKRLPNSSGGILGAIGRWPIAVCLDSALDSAVRARALCSDGGQWGQENDVRPTLHFLCERGFEHHVAANLSTVASAVYEATTCYLGWEMHWHNCENGAC